MRIGYSYWGFLGDNKLDKGLNELSTPDGNATYSWALIHEAQRRGHVVFQMQEDRDAPAIGKYGPANFSAFSCEKRMNAWTYMRRPDGCAVSEFFPELDVLLLEWRWPIAGAKQNMYPSQPGYQPDLERQVKLLNHYCEHNQKTKIIIWDLDHKLEIHDERHWLPDAIFETSVHPRKLQIERTRVEPPCIVADLLQFPTLPADTNRKLVYVGSRYERDDIIDEWIAPVSNRFQGQVKFYGNWLKTLDECAARWPYVHYMDRITTKGFREAYGTAVACPLLAKRSYLETGFITPRPWEALLFGTLPIGLGTHEGIDEYVANGLIARDGRDMAELVAWVAKGSLEERDRWRRRNVEKLEFMDARYFVDKIENVVSST